jgi:hypothetical protein
VDIQFLFFRLLISINFGWNAQKGSSHSWAQQCISLLSSNAEAYLKGLGPAASQLSELGLSPETLAGWRAGYYKSGGRNKG